MFDRSAVSDSFAATEGTDPGYRALHPIAVTSVGLGLISVLAFGHPVLLIVPALAMATGAYAWRAITWNSETWTGRKLALVGMGLALFFATAAVSRFVSRQVRLVTDADAAAMQFFGYLAQDDVFKAHQLMVEPVKRLPLDDKLVRSYQDSSKLNMDIRTWTKLPAIRSLLALGSRARVRPYQTEGQRYRDHTDTLDRVYAVSFEQDGRLQTFFVRLVLSRSIDEDSGVVGWALGDVRAPVTPEGWDGAKSID